MNRYTKGKPVFSLALRVVAGYAVFSAPWIVLSDHLLRVFYPHPAPVAHLQTLKGLLFVTLSAFLMYWLTVRGQRACSLAQEQIRKPSMAVEQSANSVVIANLQGVIEYVNPAFCDITGYAAK
jgi:PAS domain S-box